MSSQTLSPSIVPESAARVEPLSEPVAASRTVVAMSRTDRDEPFNEFDYRPVPVAAPIALFLGLSSVIGVFSMVGLVVGVAGLLLGLRAALRIRRSEGEYSGQWVAVTGAVLSLVVTSLILPPPSRMASAASMFP